MKAVVLAIMAALMLSAVGIVRAHEAPSGFTYAYFCCGDGDCAVATPTVVDKGGQKTLGLKSDKHDATAIDKASVRMPSPDGAWHLCATPRELAKTSGSVTVYCVYVPEMY